MPQWKNILCIELAFSSARKKNRYLDLAEDVWFNQPRRKPVSRRLKILSVYTVLMLHISLWERKWPPRVRNLQAGNPKPQQTPVAAVNIKHSTRSSSSIRHNPKSKSNPFQTLNITKPQTLIHPKPSTKYEPIHPPKNN